MPSPVVELNRAVALSMAFGPEVGLALLDQLTAFLVVQHYHCWTAPPPATGRCERTIPDSPRFGEQ